MEEKQLNFDQPLLSVRRFSFGAAFENQSKKKSDISRNIPQPPPFNSELKSGPVTNPGTVPFFWETTPGRPKDETRQQTQTVERPLTAPELPPGRALADAEGPCTNGDQLGSISRGSTNVLPLDEDGNRIRSPEDMKEVENSSSVDNDEAYVDALDTLSRAESLFLNCSESGLSGLDDPNAKIYGTSSRDPQTRDFMIGRFLPAAKAMASGTPQHAPRKPPIIKEQPRRVKKVISGDKPPQLRYGPNFMSDYTQCHDSREEESDDDHDEQKNLPARVCGLLPRLGLQGSFCLLNPLPGTSMRSREPITPLSKTESTPPSGCKKLDPERYQLNTNGQRHVGGIQMIKPQAHRKNVKTDDNWTNYWRHRGKPEGISSQRDMVVGGISSDRNGPLQSYEPKAALSISGPAKNSEAMGMLDNSTLQSYLELLDDRHRTEELDRRIPLFERNLSIDTGHKVKYLDLESSSFDRKKQSGSKGEREILSERIKRYPSLDASFGFDEKLSIVDKATTTRHDFKKPIDFLKVPVSDKVNQDTSTVTLKTFGNNQDLHKGASMLANLKVPRDEYSKAHQKIRRKVAKSETYSEFPVPPPLPKSPSDSWLGRTLPTMSAKNAPRYTYLGTGTTLQYQVSEPKSSAPKWETIVKTTSD